MPALMPALTILLGMFGLVGLFAVYRALRAAHEERRAAGLLPPPGRTLREWSRDYVGPMDVPAPLTPPLRVLVEFWFALMGFPGLGWLLSRRMLPGILLISIVPSLVWAIVPVLLVRSGLMTWSVWTLVGYLPVVAALSAGSLAVMEFARPKEQRA